MPSDYIDWRVLCAVDLDVTPDPDELRLCFPTVLTSIVLEYAAVELPLVVSGLELSGAKHAVLRIDKCDMVWLRRGRSHGRWVAVRLECREKYAHRPWHGHLPWSTGLPAATRFYGRPTNPLTVFDDGDFVARLHRNRLTLVLGTEPQTWTWTLYSGRQASEVRLCRVLGYCDQVRLASVQTSRRVRKEAGSTSGLSSWAKMRTSQPAPGEAARFLPTPAPGT
jgi:hypothetical protein